MTTVAVRPTRVLLLIDSFQMGGAERITAALLPHLDRSRVTPILCTLRSRGDSPLAAQLGDNIRRIDLGAKRMIDPAAFQRLLRLLQEEHIDLIHAQLQDSTVMAVAAHKLTGIPVVVTRHLIGEDHLSDGKRTLKQRLRNNLERISVQAGVARVITVSNATRDVYANQTGLPLNRFRTIYNGIDLEKFSRAEDKTVVKKALWLPMDNPLVTMVGVLRPGKGHSVCIEAARSVPNAHFVLVGDGMLRESLEAQAKDLKGRVHFLGQRMDIAAILSATDIFVLPSDSEALPTVLIEAGAAGLPVVASNVGGVPEIVEDGVTGILIPPQDPQALADAIKRLIDDPVLARGMGDEAYQRVREKFTLSSQTTELIELYESVLCETQQGVVL
jgi:glycosyltransferase involved in cell wall biosynthesis